MAGSSASNIWVVGWEDGNIAVQFHWNGKNWSNKTYRGSFPTPGAGFTLFGVETMPLSLS